jgi:hypothetical protein
VFARVTAVSTTAAALRTSPRFVITICLTRGRKRVQNNYAQSNTGKARSPLAYIYYSTLLSSIQGGLEAHPTRNLMFFCGTGILAVPDGL